MSSFSRSSSPGIYVINPPSPPPDRLTTTDCASLPGSSKQASNAHKLRSTSGAYHTCDSHMAQWENGDIRPQGGCVEWLGWPDKRKPMEMGENKDNLESVTMDYT
ncbi:hypothetical protein GUJ93_ZPchr0005g15082 [Zizania palustris]|uniref:Uncharacterized protein n=1 Tax=Zizania palustris TaxID=103762 RepID=A0A8J5W198_ZIZPA|nr:hypothetical protein GUJ93_ZPchr0005g15082 [Zizania palustris]